MGNFIQNYYLTASRGSGFIILFQCIALGHILSALYACPQEASGKFSMEGEGCCSITANMELETAREMYETRIVSKNKRKISALEASVKAKEQLCIEEDIAQDVNWL